MLRSTVPLACVALVLAACTSGTSGRSAGSSTAPTTAATTPSVSLSSTPTRSTPAAHPVPHSTTTPTHHDSLPLPFNTGDATQVITAIAPSMTSTTGTLQAWQKTGSGWVRVGPSTPAWFGSQGLTTHMSESVTATPVGSYTLTQAFGARANPGSGLPYFQTTPADWWISQTTGAGAAVYNTHQRCVSNCAFDTDTRNNPNEHLAYELPYYNYAVVVDYNTRNAPGGVRLGAGSAVFLHVSVGAPTAGCISIDESRLVAIMRWLTPSAHPRILIGV